ncbi:MarR family transcriptional regulator [Spongiivirga sp. MCCC 1A20706]|uniref:MarR family winged helix-turn-helix transcriptional regulator n=1 Tax=Spongiivirga sp. MCCC 1A20706 TaxID=3160963 RepID=UPI0039773909
MKHNLPHKIEQQLASHIMRTGSYIEAKIVNHLKQYGLTMTQYNILEMLFRSNPSPMSVGGIKRKIPHTNSDITRLIDRLVKKKLVKRTLSAENRRKMDVVLSKTGYDMIKKLIPEIKMIMSKLYKTSIDETEAKKMMEMLERIR